MFQAMEEHRGLRTVAFNIVPNRNPFTEDNNNPEDWYSLLEHLLTRNRRMTVCGVFVREIHQRVQHRQAVCA
jgi:hypothetical protein